MRGMEEAAEIAGEAAGSAVVAGGVSQIEAGGAAGEAAKDAGASGASQAGLGSVAEANGDERHRGKYESGGGGCYAP